jgi:hypothetical protein
MEPSGRDVAAPISTEVATVAISARHLGTPDRDEAVVEADARRGESGRKALLIDLVRARYPEAEFRSYANSAASFLAPKLLIVAAYRDSREPEAASPAAPVADHRQQNLFAA